MTVTITGGITFSGGLTFTPSGAAANDPYFMYNSLLLPGNGTNLAQNNTFLDGSTNNFTITRAGNTTQGTFSPYGANWSNYFDGTGDYLTTPASVNMNIGTGDFTFETWIFPTITSAGQALISFANTNVFYFNSSRIPCYGIYLVSDTQIGSTAVALNTWSHIAFVRSGTTLTCYINGTSVGSITTASSIGTSVASNYIGSHQGGNYWNGYLSNARVVKGTAVYTGNFTPSTTPLTAIANTSLLTCADNRFIDDSTNAFAITVNGNTNIQRFSPFSPTQAYSTSTIGGSGYFDGTGDNLSIANNANLAIGSGQFTVEMWIYFNTVTTLGEFFEFTTTSNGGCFTLYFNGSNNLQAVATGGAGVTSVTWTPTAGQWYHLAASRDASNNQRVFVNGVLLGTATSTNNYAQNGFRTFSATHNGYIADARAIVGSCLYTTSFTPPTAPLTAVSGTILLLSATNGGIIDNAMMNNLETVGNAQISTTQSKFGGSSMSFDGTGDYLVPSAPNSNLNLVLGTGNFTIEFWVYFNSGLGSDIVLYDSRPLTTNGVYPTLYVNSSSQLSYVVSGTDQITSGSAFSATTWYHVALCRSSTSTKMFINGTQVGSTYIDSNNYLNPARRPVIAINGYNETAAPLNGYMDDLRVTKGYARYTSNFTPPTAALPTY
jgi:hypothetical protein